jgi:hypothetical protein
VATWTDNERSHIPQFDRALAKRDAGELPEALALLEELVAQLTQSDKRLLMQAHLQIVNILRKLERTADAEVHARFATHVAPRAELASLALFHVLDNLGRRVESLIEIVRFLSLRESLGYRELFTGDAFSAGPFASLFSKAAADERRLAKEARRLLAKHRDAQRARPTPIVLDTVRISASAPAALRPGTLASVYSIDGERLRVAFSDGEIMEASLALIDHHDI